MSRSRSHSKGPGYEYWGTRGAPHRLMLSPGRDAKAYTHRCERRTGDRLTARERTAALTDSDVFWRDVPPSRQ